MLPITHPLYEAGKQLAARLDAFSIEKLKTTHGLNRAYRRKLRSLKRRGKLTVNDLPLWLIARHTY